MQFVTALPIKATKSRLSRFLVLDLLSAFVMAGNRPADNPFLFASSKLPLFFPYRLLLIISISFSEVILILYQVYIDIIIPF